jgi:eukaryotic-like serine/threonine-protein kinase
MITLQYDEVFAGRYRIVRNIASGGMGAVYEAVHTETERHIALKVLLPSLADRPEIRERFKNEAKITASIESDAIVQIFDAGVDAETQMPFLAMELLRGGDLATLLKNRPLSVQDCVKYLHRVALALDKTHLAGVVHRDLKPENLFLARREDGSLQIKVLDFGVAKLVVEGTANAGTTSSFGTPLYMAPEQFMATPVSAATDIYSLGMIAFTLLVGVAYWEPEAAERATVFAFANIAIRGTTEAATARAAKVKVKLPEAFDPWFWRMTAKRPEDRYQSASAAIEALAAALEVDLPGPESAGIEAPELGAASHTTMSEVLPPQRDAGTLPLLHRRVLAAIAVAAIAGSVVAGIFTVRSAKQQQALPPAPELDAVSIEQGRQVASAQAATSALPEASQAAEWLQAAPDASSSAAATTGAHAPGKKPVASASAPAETAPAPATSRRGLYSRE